MAPRTTVAVVALTALDGRLDYLGSGQGATVAEAASLAVLQAVARLDRSDVRGDGSVSSSRVSE